MVFTSGVFLCGYRGTGGTDQNCYGEIVIVSFIIGNCLLERNLNMLNMLGVAN